MAKSVKSYVIFRFRVIYLYCAKFIIYLHVSYCDYSNNKFFIIDCVLDYLSSVLEILENVPAVYSHQIRCGPYFKNKLLNTSCHSHPQFHLRHPLTSLATKIPTFLPKNCGNRYMIISKLNFPILLSHHSLMSKKSKN